MSAKSKMMLFMAVVTIATIFSLVQGIISGRLIPLVLGFIGAASIAMWILALRSTRKDSNHHT
ncbi:hypothetical protein [Streptomyces cremeus]